MSSMENNQKHIYLSKQQFAEALFYWLSDFLTEEAITKSAQNLGFAINDDYDTQKILNELFDLNMWLIVYTCTDILEDENTKNECLDIFHHLVYEKYATGIQRAFDQWIKLLCTKYIEYNSMLKPDHPTSPFSPVTKQVTQNLFGETAKDSETQEYLINHISLFIKHLGSAITKYDIE